MLTSLGLIGGLSFCDSRMTHMLLGPVFRAELLRTARKRHYYFLRVVYGIVLLMILWLNFEQLLVMAQIRGGKPLIADFAEFAMNTFAWFMGVQLATILVLVPTLFGGVIADEKQRKTMHYLMASRLSSGEIVLDKLAARLLHVGVFILLGMPVMCLLTLFGGVAWDYVVGAYAATFSITFFAAALAVLISTFARRVGQGVLIAYVLEIGWLIVPPVVDVVCRWLFPGLYLWIEPVSEWVRAATPVSLLIWTRPFYRRQFLGMTRGVPPTFLDQFLWMMGLQCALGVILLLIAGWQLRPTFRRQEESRPWVTWFSRKVRRPRWLNRPECGTDAMLWKERHFARTDLFTKLVVLPATILLTVAVLLSGDLDEKVMRSFSSVWQQGYTSRSREPIDLNEWLHAVIPLYVSLWLLAAAGASASGITVERERDTWDSLISTPLTGWEIIRGKLVGAVWGLRGFGGLISLFWLLGLAAGAVHPLGLLLSLLVVGLLTWFVTALGTYASLTARTTSRALTITIATLLFLNVGYLGVLYPMIMVFSEPSEWRYPGVGVTPVLASGSLLSYRQAASIVGTAQDPGQLDGLDYRGVLYGVMVLIGYAIAAAMLIRWSIRRFAALVDRPRRE
jgi:ABC-type transport system involved in multi-copper enzyme maturation permease subunit